MLAKHFTRGVFLLTMLFALSLLASAIDLSVSISPSDATPHVGEKVTYTVSYYNNEGKLGFAGWTVLSATLPDGSNPSWDIGTLWGQTGGSETCSCTVGSSWCGAYGASASLSATAFTTAYASCTITVIPLAANQGYRIDAGQTLTTTTSNSLLSGATKTGIGVLEVHSHGTPSHGTLSNFNNATGTFTYTPNAGYSGTDSFTFTLDDTKETSNTATATITVGALPDAVNDSYSVNDGSTLSVAAPGLLSNDTGTSLTVASNTQPSHGTLTVNANGSFSYTPNAGFWGTDTFTYTDTDGYTTSNTATVTITVYSVPVANNDSYNTNENAALTTTAATGVLANDTNADGGALTATKVTGPSHGTLTFNANGSFTYTPTTGFSGTDSFTYTAADSHATSNTATVTIAVYSYPVANNDSYSAVAGQTLTVAAPGVLSNDTTADERTLTASLVATTSHGSLTLNSNGSFSYTPTSGYWGTDTFTYKALDGTAASNTATVTLTVDSVPVANAAAFIVKTGQTLTVAAPGLLGYTTDADGATLSATLASNPAHGSISFNNNGSFTYVPIAGFTGTDSFTYTATDGHATSAPGTVTITVYGIPVANPDSYSVSAGGTLTVSAANGVLANDDDPNGERLTATPTTGSLQSLKGSLVMNADGSFIFTPNAGFSGTTSFQYLASDIYATSVPTTVSIYVDAIPVANNDVYSVIGGNTLNVSATTAGVLANDTTADGRTLTAVLSTNPANGTLTFNANGTFTYVPNANFAGVDSFTYTAQNGVSVSNIATVTIHVTSIPVPYGGTFSVIDGNTLTVTAPGLLQYSNADGSPCTMYNHTPPADGSLTLNADGSFSYTPNAGFCGWDWFGYTLISSEGVVSWFSQVNIYVYSVPVATADAYAVVAGQTLTVTAANGVLANDTNADGGALTATKITAPAHGQLTFNANGSFVYTPNAGFYGTDSFTYTATDGNATSAPATVTLTVYSVPVAYGGSYETQAGQTLTVGAPGVLEYDTNADGGALSATLVNTTTNGSLSLNANGSFSYTPNAGFTGTDSFSYTAGDAHASSSAATVTITVVAALAANPDAYSTVQGMTLTVDAPGVLANDSNPGGGDLFVADFTEPANGDLLLNEDGSFSYTPDTGFSGTDSFTYAVTDGYNVSASTTVTLTVYSIPVAVADNYTAINGVTATVSATNGVLANDTNADGLPLTASLVNNVAHGQLTLNANGSFSYTPTLGYYGTDSFTYTAADTHAVSAPATVTFTVYSTPVANPDSYGVVAGHTLTVNAPGVLANDTNADGGSMTTAVATTTSHGTLGLSTNGAFTYTPTAGFSGTDTFTYKATNANATSGQRRTPPPGGGGATSAAATVTITVYSVPVANPDTYTVTTGHTLTVTAANGVLANDTNADGGTLSAVKVTGTPNGLLTLQSEWSFSYTPSAGFTGTDSFTYTATDGYATSTAATVTITVLLAPRWPTLTATPPSPVVR